MTRTSSRNDRRAPKIENPQRQSTRKSTLYTATTTTSQKDHKASEDPRIHPAPKGLKAVTIKKPGKPVGSVITIYT